MTDTIDPVLAGFLQYGLGGPGASTLLPAAVQAGSTTTLTLTASSASWTAGSPGSPSFTASSGTVISQSVTSASSAALTYAAPASAGPVTFTDSAGDPLATLLVTGVTRQMRWYPGVGRGFRVKRFR